MYEKTENNISKWDAIEKEPSTLEKNKEDHSKYYLSYPKTIVLDLNWKIVILILQSGETFQRLVSYTI